MENHELFISESDPMTVKELLEQLQKIIDRDSGFLDAQIYCEGDGVRHRMIGLTRVKDTKRMTGEREYLITLLDEGGVDYEEKLLEFRVEPIDE
jgi:hypothetical protein